MDWNQIYVERHKKLKGWSFDKFIRTRIQRFKSSYPTNSEHYLELAYLLLNYDWRRTLIKRYMGIISEELKDEWLKKRLIENKRGTSEKHNIYLVLLPF